MLGVILLAKNPEFRKYVRTTYNQEGEKQYVPHNLDGKKVNMRMYTVGNND